MDKEIRNRIQRATQAARALLEREYAEQLEGTFDIRLDGTIAAEPGGHLDAQQRVLRTKLVAAVEHVRSSVVGHQSAAEAVIGYLREAAFTTLNRFVALKMLEARGLVQECMSRGEQSAGFKEFTGLAPGLVQLPDHGYRLYIESLFDEIGREVRVLFDRRDPANLLWPRRQALQQLLDTLNDPDLAKLSTDDGRLTTIWHEDETIGWVYQYFNSDEERRQMRAESQAPRNSRELAVRNQFFTPRYVVEFLTDNTLGRIWYEMRQGKTRLVDECDYLVRRPTEILLAEGEPTPEDDSIRDENLSQEELLRKPVYIPFRAKKDPRDLKILDPACGSGHFLLYAFDLLVTIYEEAWQDDSSPSSEVTGRNLRDDYETLEGLRCKLPGLVLRHNLHGIDIDPRAVQIAALALWMRAQRAHNDFGFARGERSPISKTSIVVAEPMPGEKEVREEFIASLIPRLGKLVEWVFEKMELAGEAGSLLKIDHDIQSAIRDIYSGTGELFRKNDEERWRDAEEKLIEALLRYADQAQNGRSYKRRLFAEDATRGFGFLDLCRQQYDVMLMNPPFGEAPSHLQALFSAEFSSWNKNVLCAFLERCIDQLKSGGRLGSVIDRTIVNKSTYEAHRSDVLLRNKRLDSLLDLGWGILDANVEVAALTLSKRVDTHRSSVACIDVREVALQEKDSATRLAIGSHSHRRVWWHNAEIFVAFPNSAIVYDLPEKLLASFQRYPSLIERGYTAYTGHQIESARHFFLAWEISPYNNVAPDKNFCWLYNGGEYSRYFLSTREIARFGYFSDLRPEDVTTYTFVLRNRKHHFAGGVGFGVRGDYLDAHPLPDGFLFTVEGQVIPVQSERERYYVLALLNSTVANRLLNTYCGQHKYSGYVNRLPCPIPEQHLEDAIVECAMEACAIKARWDSFSETSARFCEPFWASHCSDSLETISKYLQAESVTAIERLSALSRKIDDLLVELYCANDLDVIADIKEYRERLPAESLPFVSSHTTDESRQLIAETVISFCVGRCFGRWSEVTGWEKSTRHSISNVFDSLPTVIAGTKVNPDVFVERFANSPVILTNDPGHEADISESVRSVLHTVWGNAGLEREHEITAFLSTESLRAYLCSSRFFDSHIKTYSIGRRKAPIYWQLSTPSTTYSIWLYYHRFTKDTFYKVLNDYVTPKLQHEEQKLTDHVQSAGGRPTASQRKEIAEQEAFVEELRAFREEIARIAPLWNPDLNDGVLINFAPLWRLVPQHRTWQKECKACWDKLVAGDYDWAHLAMHLWPERVVPKCAEDRSLAIAHGLEEVFWVEGDDGKWQPRKVDPETIDQLIKERTSAAVKDALKGLLEAPAQMTKRSTTRAKGTRRKSSPRTSRSAATNGPDPSMLAQGKAVDGSVIKTGEPHGDRDDIAGEAHA